MKDPKYQMAEIVFVGQQGPFTVHRRVRSDPNWLYILQDDNGIIMRWGGGDGDPWIEQQHLRRQT
jgi:hypothetical protein